MSLPIILGVGEVAMYGNCQNTVYAPDGSSIDGRRFGTIYNIWDGGGAYAQVGDIVAFNETDVRCRVATGGSSPLTYTVVPARLAVKYEVPL